MTRYAIASLLLSACAALAAPVPRQAPPKQLTADMMVGTWHYEWDDLLDGVISFDAGGGYTAVHVPGGCHVYYGSWRVEADAVILTEYVHNLDTNARGGPSEYRFRFKPADYPRLKGLSNGAGHVALSRVKP